MFLKQPKKNSLNTLVKMRNNFFLPGYAILIRGVLQGRWIGSRVVGTKKIYILQEKKMDRLFHVYEATF